MTIRILNIELSIRVINKKRITGYSSRRWTEREVNAMLRFKNEGRPTEEIAKLLNRTPTAITIKLSKVRSK